MDSLLQLIEELNYGTSAKGLSDRLKHYADTLEALDTPGGLEAVVRDLRKVAKETQAVDDTPARHGRW